MRCPSAAKHSGRIANRSVPRASRAGRRHGAGNQRKWPARRRARIIPVMAQRESPRLGNASRLRNLGKPPVDEAWRAERDHDRLLVGRNVRFRIR